MLRRYPNIDSGELAELIDFYNSSPAIDTALLTCDAGLQPQITRFQSEHRKNLRHMVRLPALHWVLAVTFILLAYAMWLGAA